VWWKRAKEVRPVVDPDRLRGCFYGGAMGDALGFQFENRGPPAGDSLDRLGAFSDDTQLTLATAKAIASSQGRVDPEVIVEEAAEEYGTSGYVVESVPLAIWAASNEERSNFRSLIQRLVRLGDDCDSIASMAGQLFGARFGMSALPPEWLLQLRQGSQVESAATAFLRST
jgi:ADP-ribosylglycohydrolase